MIVMASYLVVIYGAPLAGKSSVAAELACSLPGKSAIVSIDHLVNDAIARPAESTADELEMVYVQARLLVANYMKNGYHVVVEGPFYHERGGGLHRFEPDIDQLVSLMRQMTQKALTVHLTASDAALEARARAGGRDAGAALRIDTLYRQHYGSRALTFDTSTDTASDIAGAIREKLLAEEFT